MNIKSAVYLATLLASILLTVLRYWQDPLLNTDGVLYVHMARQVAMGSEASGLFDLNFYPDAIGIFAKYFFDGDVILAGQVLNGALHGLLCVGFLRLAVAFGMRERMLWIAALAVLGHELLVDYRSYFIRDFGFWAFGTLAISELAMFARDQKFYRIVLWPLWLGLGMLFRYEAPVLGLASVGLLFLDGRPTRSAIVCFIRFNMLALAAVAVISSLWLLGAFAAGDGVIAAVVDRFMARLQGSEFGRMSSELELILLYWSRDEASFILAAGFLALVPKKVASALGAYQILLALLCVRCRFVSKFPLKSIWFFAFIGVLLYLSGFALQLGFLTTRYAIFGALLLMLVITFAVTSRWGEFGVPGKGAVVFLLVVSLIDGIVSTGDSKQYQVDAINWMKKSLPGDAVLLSNHGQLALQPMKQFVYEDYHALKAVLITGKSIASGEAEDIWVRSDYMALLYEHDQDEDATELLATGRLEKVKEFASEIGDRVLIYKVDD